MPVAMGRFLADVLKAYQGIFELSTPFSGGGQGDRNTLADVFATLTSVLATAAAVAASPYVPGIAPDNEWIALTSALLLIVWAILTYVLIAGRDFARFKRVLPLNLNLVAVWMLFSLAIVLLVSALLGEPGNRGTQSLVAFAALIVLVALQVALSKLPMMTRLGYAFGLLVSCFPFVSGLYGLRPMELLDVWCESFPFCG